MSGEPSTVSENLSNPAKNIIFFRVYITRPDLTDIITTERVTGHQEQKEHEEYLRVVEGDLTELWSRYGQLFEIWFDGGVVTRQDGGADVAKLLEEYQPQAICFQGPKEHGQNLRWIGNEDARLLLTPGRQRIRRCAILTVKAEMN